MSSGPDFFVVGAPRAGTTSLYHYLGQHPEIFTPAVKEPQFFSWPQINETYYQARFVGEQSDYLALFSGRTDERAAGDFSTSYMHEPTAAQRICDFNPRAKIVMVLRNPVERALSHHRMDLRDGYASETLETLISRDCADPRFRLQYITAGCYAEHISRFRQLFDDDQIHIALFEDLTERPGQMLERLFRFLDVDYGFNVDVREIRNSTNLRRTGPIGRLASSRLARVVGPYAGTTLRLATQRLLGPQTQAKVSQPGAREVLTATFAQEIDDLEALVDIDLSRWRSELGL